jgi:uncharacterized alpha-E superfamily protein
MLTRSKSTTDTLKDSASTATDLATKLAKDKKFRKELAAAISHGVHVRRQARRRAGLAAVAARLSLDPRIRREVRAMFQNLDKALARVERKQSHKTRNTVLVLAGVGAIAAAAPHAKKIAFGKKDTDN